jgi:hypothetical protein
MFLIPLNQLESVELVIHALRMAGGAVDCAACPAYKVCTKQCLAVADSIEQMMLTNNLPRFGDGRLDASQDLPPEPTEPPPGGGHLRRVK